MYSEEAQHSYPEAIDYISNYTKENDVASYLELLRELKQQFLYR
ncbi:MAG: hypothetical protein R2759_03910 [Bacteroidales bacterium]